MTDGEQAVNRMLDYIDSICRNRLRQQNLRVRRATPYTMRRVSSVRQWGCRRLVHPHAAAEASAHALRIRAHGY